MIDFDKIKLFGKWIHLEKDQSKMHGILHLPDGHEKVSPFSRVLKVGPDVPDVVQVGQIAVVGSYSKFKAAHNVVDSKTETKAFICPWDEVVARNLNELIIPIGRRILVKRVIREDSDIVKKIDVARDNIQGLIVEIVRRGIPLEDNEFKIAGHLMPGTICKIKQWEQHIFELGIKGEYHFILNETDLEYYECD